MKRLLNNGNNPKIYKWEIVTIITNCDNKFNN